MLMIVALLKGDDQAFESHARGLSTLLIHRTRNIESVGKHIKPQWYPFDPLLHQQKLPFTGIGIKSLVDKGFISQSAWSAYFKEAMVLSSLILITPGDTFWWELPLRTNLYTANSLRCRFSAMTQHKWLAGNPEALGSTALDKVFHSALRLSWHLIAWQGALLTSPIVRGMILEIYACLDRSDVEMLLQQQPSAIAWVAMTAGPHAMNLQGWFHVLLRLSLAAWGVSRFDEAMELLARDYLWHPNLNGNAELFWTQNASQLSLECCSSFGKPGNGLQFTEQQLNASFESLELGSKFRPELQTQSRKSPHCLCAWWI